MIASTVSFATHLLISSFKLFSPVTQVLGYVVPYFNSMAGINFNTKHLGKGDPLPPHTGKVRVYNMRYCPYAQRTILALNAKQIDYEVINIDLLNKPEWLVSKSAFGKVPAVEIDENVCIYESLITVEYIDEYFPQRPLLSKDPAKKALDKIVVEAMAPVTALFYRCVKMPETVTKDMTVAYYKALDFLQAELKKRNTPFLGGCAPAYADYMIWPWFERILVLDGVNGKMTIGDEKYKLLLDYFGRMFEDPAVSPYLVPQGILQKFFELYLKGEPFNYDTFFEKKL